LISVGILTCFILRSVKAVPCQGLNWLQRWSPLIVISMRILPPLSKCVYHRRNHWSV
jgi:hypothetical protein